ncbi:cytochrome b [Marinomonas sp. 2405UD66-6]|uniref:cytochrome b n=1 Tax=Marinomonas sp. 2405UD66-6 TaxID=3391834 RepID=UPI0039C8C276
MIKNTERSYGSVAKWFHWLVALCIISAYVIIYYKLWFLDSDDASYRSMLSIHVAIGFSVIGWASLRIIWKFMNPQPKMPDMPKWQSMSAHGMHGLLYFFMFAMPISGWFGFGGSVNYGFFEIPSFRNTGLGQWILDLFNTEWDVWEKKWDFFHKDVSGPWILWVLVVAHVGAALHHHIVKKDNTLTRMLPGKKEK